MTGVHAANHVDQFLSQPVLQQVPHSAGVQRSEYLRIRTMSREDNYSRARGLRSNDRW
jgi:hypothetical protein